jgi:Na+/H+ antiporter NhaD/arsenite permease-like protein
MTGAQALLGAVLVIALVLQAVFPARRLLVVTSGGAIACFAATLLGVSTTRTLLSDVPWDVIVILVGLGLFTELLASSGLFGVLALASTRRSGGDPRKVLALFAVAMYLVSSLVNNLTALLLVLPVLLILFKLLGVEQRYVSWTLGVLLVACNLGGAATPIGDFPAILLLGRGSMTFRAYLVAAAPPTAAALLLLLVVVYLVIRPDRSQTRDPISTRLSLAVMGALYRNVKIDRRTFLPLVVVMAAMLVAWVMVPASSGLGPELICWIGVGVALLVRPTAGERVLRTRVDVEAVLYLLSLFVMVAAVRRSDLFAHAARGLLALPVPPVIQLLLFLVAAGLLTGIFSAGPSMAALLEVAESLAKQLPPTAVYVGLALSVCAGSSLVLTAATSGPMAQILTERANLRDGQDRPVRFGFFEFLPVGLVSFALIQGVAIAYTLLVLSLSV